ncbi:hypothetical protein DFH09DRAFT_137079 [Mycena vulgaris]|nr:hypothetical protein DFH09DRAFT_137079 [Mycena vulgaris]
MSRIFAFSLAALCLNYVAAETTLIVPFADPQPISGDVLGVDTALGRTTWALHQGAFTGTWTDPQGSFPGTATLIEGSDYASFTYVVADMEGTITAGGECSLKDGQQICVAAADGVTVTATESATPFGIEGGSTLAGAAQVTPAPSGSGSNSGGSAIPASGSESSAPSSTQPSASIQVCASASALGVLVALFMAYHLV